MAPKVWLITGCSSGFGEQLALEALSRGDKVIATARNVAKLEGLKKAGSDVMALDVTASLEQLRAFAAKALHLYDRIDILINNAGYAMQGSLEELSPEETQKQFDTNVFGLLNVTRAFLPYFRQQRAGAIANFSSIAGWRGSAGIGIYAASKWAVSGISESLSMELADFGISVCCIEPGYFRSNFLNPGNRLSANGHIADYDGTAARQVASVMEEKNNKQDGDIVKGARVIVDVLTEKGGRKIPMRLTLGTDAYAIIGGKCRDTLKLLDEWKDVTTMTDHDDVV